MSQQSNSILVIGGGIVGAMVTYALGQSGRQVTLLDKQNPAQGSTGAALGVLMGAISRKTKGRAWAMRQQSLGRYDTLISELQRQTGHTIDYNRDGIVKLLFEGDNGDRWRSLAQARQAQGWQLDIWDRETLRDRCPSVTRASSPFGPVVGAVHSPGDRQIHPQQLTLALLEAARRQGAQTDFGAEVRSVGEQGGRGYAMLTTGERHEADWIVLTAGMGTSALAASEAIDIRPVLGQALEVVLEFPLEPGHFRPVVTGNDIHVVPLATPDGRSGARYWIGATVEFPPDGEATIAAAVEAERHTLWERAIALHPVLASATISKTWWGKRPRPFNRPAPIIEQLPGYDRVIVASGHYRNGVLLAPATAQAVVDMIQSG